MFEYRIANERIIRGFIGGKKQGQHHNDDKCLGSGFDHNCQPVRTQGGDF